MVICGMKYMWAICVHHYSRLCIALGETIPSYMIPGLHYQHLVSSSGQFTCQDGTAETRSNNTKAFHFSFLSSFGELPEVAPLDRKAP